MSQSQWDIDYIKEFVDFVSSKLPDRASIKELDKIKGELENSDSSILVLTKFIEKRFDLDTLLYEFIDRGN
jgi:hypothetical protein